VTDERASSGDGCPKGVAQPALGKGGPSSTDPVRGSISLSTLRPGRPIDLMYDSLPNHSMVFPFMSSTRVREINSPDGGKLSRLGLSPSAIAAEITHVVAHCRLWPVQRRRGAARRLAAPSPPSRGANARSGIRRATTRPLPRLACRRTVRYQASVFPLVFIDAASIPHGVLDPE
jgi:hypothetical protein